MVILGAVQNRWALTLALILIIAVYLTTLQTIPNGASDPYMIDVGEAQVALNVWGTLHATGYPLYTLLGNLFTPLPQVLTINAAAAASLFSLWWTLLALLGFYGLLRRFTENEAVAGGSVLLLGLMRSIWIHSVIAEVYSLSLAILIGWWLVALHPRWSFRGRFWMAAFLVGLGIAHHRALAFGGLGLIFALLPEIRRHLKQLPRLLPTAALLFSLGFLPYVYLPLRASAKADWVYSEAVNTWDGFWFNFWGKEADYLVKTPNTVDGWIENFMGTLDILSREMTPVGLLLAVLSLLIACWKSPQRRLAWMAALSGLGFFAFAVGYHQAVLPEAILMMALPSLGVAVALSVDWLWREQRYLGWLGAGLLLVWELLLIPNSHAFIRDLVTDPTGLESIQAASDVPRTPLEQPVFMLSWGPRYFAASYSRLVTRENADLMMVDHTADFTALAQAGRTFYTEPDTLFGYPLTWWEERIGKVYLTSAGVNLVRLGTQPRLIEAMDTRRLMANITNGIWLAGAEVSCDEKSITLAVGWYAEKTPERDLSVKVHLTRATSPIPLEQADSSAPVHGWRPTSTWLAGELISDHYRLAKSPAGEQIILGLYEQLANGSFANYGDTIIPLKGCG